MKRFLSATCWSLAGGLIAGALPIVWLHVEYGLIRHDNLALDMGGWVLAPLIPLFALAGAAVGFAIWAAKAYGR
jgi:hypothetical protein